MSQVNMNQGAQPQTAQGADDVTLAGRVLQSGASMPGDAVPPAKDGKPDAASATELPVLPEPALPVGGFIALDILLDAIGDKVRQSEVKAGIAEVKARAAQQEEANKKKLKMIEGQIDKLKNDGTWDLICNIFKYIAMAVTAVACLAVLASGVGSAVGVAGLVLLGVSFADQILDPIGMAVTGRHGWGLTSLIGWSISAGTGSGTADHVVKSVLDVVLRIATVLCTSGAGFAGAADALTKTEESVTEAVVGAINASDAIAKVTEGVTKTVDGVTKAAEGARNATESLAQVTEGIAEAAGGVTAAGKSVVAAVENFLTMVSKMISKAGTASKRETDTVTSGTATADTVYTNTNDAAKARADQKRLQAILEQIQMVNDIVATHMKQVIKDSRKTAETVGEIVKENADAQTAILTGGGGAAMA
jgi:uncharacterized protein YoxC